jgi:hypothetical protein
MEKSAFDLGTLPWAEYPAYVGVAQNLESGFVRIYLEFGAFHTFPDLPPEEETAVTAVEGATLRIAVPRHTRVEVTEVVADQFSRYYRWRILAGPTVKVDAEPSIVFTN